MAKLTMKRMELLALVEDSKTILDLLQRRGVIEITDYEETEALYKLSTTQSLSIFEKCLSTAQSAQLVLESYSPDKKSMLSAIAGRKELTVSEFVTKSETVDKTLRKCHEINTLSKRITDNKLAVVQADAHMYALKPWLDLDISMRIKETAETKVFIGSLPAFYTNESLLMYLSSAVQSVEEIAVEVISAEKDLSCIVVFCLKDNAGDVEYALREIGFIRPAEETKSLPSIRYKEYAEEITSLQESTDAAVKEIVALADLREDIEFVADYFSLRIEKYENLKKLALNDNIFVLRGYIPEDDASALAKELEGKFAVAVSISEPEESEDPPILLKNNTFTAPVESVTEMYSLPANKDVDPNPVMAFFYYTFFGLMLSDGGYGLIMVLAALYAKKKYNLEVKTKKTVNFVLFCGISTTFWGAMFGGWFGDIVQVVGKEFFNRDIQSLALWFEPVKDPMKLLLFAFLFGIIHLFVGLGVRFIMLWKAGNKLDAIFDVIPVYLLVLGVAPLGAGIIIDVPPEFSVFGKYLAIAGAFGIILTSGRSAKNIFGKLGGGLYGLYNAGSGYLGDVLSYSRLLALGLSTGVIASVVNVLGTISDNMVVKAFMLVFVFIFGHTVNIAVNLIGAYVHTNRLQYVEFFSKFYEGGGNAFIPLKSNTKYYRFKEEKTNG